MKIQNVESDIVSRRHPKLFRPIILEGTFLKDEGRSKEASFEWANDPFPSSSTS